MPKIKTKAGKIKKFPYTKAGKKAAKAKHKMPSGRMMKDSEMKKMMNKQKRMKKGKKGD